MHHLLNTKLFNNPYARLSAGSPWSCTIADLPYFRPFNDHLLFFLSHLMILCTSLASFPFFSWLATSADSHATYIWHVVCNTTWLPLLPAFSVSFPVWLPVGLSYFYFRLSLMTSGHRMPISISSILLPVYGLHFRPMLPFFITSDFSSAISYFVSAISLVPILWLLSYWPPVYFVPINRCANCSLVFRSWVFLKSTVGF
jgi:hypothetical protein